MFRRLLASLCLPLLLAACATVQQSPVPVREAYAQGGMVSAADPRAAQAGAQMLREGGNATDAALAVLVALTVV